MFENVYACVCVCIFLAIWVVVVVVGKNGQWKTESGKEKSWTANFAQQISMLNSLRSQRRRQSAQHLKLTQFYLFIYLFVYLVWISVTCLFVQCVFSSLLLNCFDFDLVWLHRFNHCFATNIMIMTDAFDWIFSVFFEWMKSKRNTNIMQFSSNFFCAITRTKSVWTCKKYIYYSVTTKPTMVGWPIEQKRKQMQTHTHTTFTKNSNNHLHANKRNECGNIVINQTKRNERCSKT